MLSLSNTYTYLALTVVPSWTNVLVQVDVNKNTFGVGVVDHLRHVGELGCVDDEFSMPVVPALARPHARSPARVDTNTVESWCGQYDIIRLSPSKLPLLKSIGHIYRRVAIYVTVLTYPSAANDVGAPVAPRFFSATTASTCRKMKSCVMSSKTAFHDRQPRTGAVLEFGKPPGLTAATAESKASADAERRFHWWK